MTVEGVTVENTEAPTEIIIRNNYAGSSPGTSPFCDWVPLKHIMNTVVNDYKRAGVGTDWKTLIFMVGTHIRTSPAPHKKPHPGKRSHTHGGVGEDVKCDKQPS